jgi:hypothetical protein
MVLRWIAFFLSRVYNTISVLNGENHFEWIYVEVFGIVGFLFRP